MPKNKNAAGRYRVINRSFQTGPKSINELIDRIEEAIDVRVCKSTIQHDIGLMRKGRGVGWEAPIKCVDGLYSYTEPGYSIDNIPLQVEEIRSLKFAATYLEQFKNASELGQLKNSIQNIVDSMNLRWAINDESTYKFVEFEKTHHFEGKHLLDPLIMAIKSKTVVEFKYLEFWSKKAKFHKVHPYILKEYKHRWYLIGLNDSDQEIRTFGLDRMKELKERKEAWYNKIDFKIAEHLQHSVGIRISGSAPIKVKIKFTKLQAEYLRTLPFHSSQKVLKENKDFVIMQFEVLRTCELEMQILAWSNEAEVLEPESLKNDIAGMLKKAAEKYLEK
jgi:predicted DNA-binding transcriptional regulator YafY